MINKSTKEKLEDETSHDGNKMIGAVPHSVVYNEDCVEGMKRFPDNYFDLAVTDPPYGIGYSELVGRVIRVCHLD